jgi:hypothetical protein
MPVAANSSRPRSFENWDTHKPGILTATPATPASSPTSARPWLNCSCRACASACLTVRRKSKGLGRAPEYGLPRKGLAALRPPDLWFVGLNAALLQNVGAFLRHVVCLFS